MVLFGTDPGTWLHATAGRIRIGLTIQPGAYECKEERPHEHNEDQLQAAMISGIAERERENDPPPGST
jgi:hypothetical protein